MSYGSIDDVDDDLTKFNNNNDDGDDDDLTDLVATWKTSSTSPRESVVKLSATSSPRATTGSVNGHEGDGRWCHGTRTLDNGDVVGMMMTMINTLP